ncbi:MAG: BatD family protein [Saprospiraceae bacterium]
MAPVWAQSSTPVFEAYADARQILSGQYFEVTFTLKNAEGRSFSPPSFNEFIVASGPARGVSTTIINGKVSKEMTYTYTLQAREVGKFMIGSATIEASGKSLRTQAFQVEVLKGKSGEVAVDQQYFVRAELSTQNAWVGQQVKLDYKLYTTVEIQNYNITQEADYVGFYAEDIQRPDARRQREIIDGVQYVTKVLKSMAIYPQQAGLLAIDPAVIQLGVVLNSGRRSSNFFFGNEIRRVPVQTERMELNVQPLPEAPEGFSGAVGNFRIGSDLERNQVTTDDALKLRLVIEGNGDLKRIQPPKINFPESFVTYEPKVQEQDIGEANTTRMGRKIIDYVSLPKEAGRYRITPKFTYFNPDSSRYITLRNTSYDITVRQGTAIKAPIIDDNAGLQEDIHGLKMDLTLAKKRPFFLGSIVFWILMILPVLALLAAVFYRKKLQELANIDPAVLKSQRAKQVAMSRLEQGATFLKSNDSRAFYDEISKAMLGYVSDKLKIPKSEMTKSNMQSKLEQLEIGTDKVARFIEIVRNCEIALFAGKDHQEAMQQTYDNALEVLAAIEKQVAD